jgi:hypothetical protein
MATDTKLPMRPWNKENFLKLKLHSRSKTPAAKISRQTKRTINELREIAHQMDLSLGHKR